jgi:hypothetical protein
VTLFRHRLMLHEAVFHRERPVTVLRVLVGQNVAAIDPANVARVSADEGADGGGKTSRRGWRRRWEERQRAAAAFNGVHPLHRGRQQRQRPSAAIWRLDVWTSGGRNDDIGRRGDGVNNVGHRRWRRRR